MPSPHLSLLIHISISAERQRAGEQNHTLVIARAPWNSWERHNDLWQTKEPKSTRILEETRGPAQFLSLTEGCLSWGWTLEVRFFSEIGHSANIFFCFIILEECFQTVTQCQRKQSSVFHQSAGHLMEFNGTIYLSKLKGITLSRTGASRKVHAPQLQRYMRTEREFWLLYCYYFRGAWRINLINVSKLASSPIKGYLNPQGWSPAVILQTLWWSEVAPDWIVSSSRCAGSARQRGTLKISLWEIVFCCRSSCLRHKNANFPTGIESGDLNLHVLGDSRALRDENPSNYSRAPSWAVK